MPFLCSKNSIKRSSSNKKELSSSVLPVGLLGFEPRQTESKSVVLPLHHNPVIYSAAKIRVMLLPPKWFLKKLLAVSL